jgi:hypothetical protein
LALQPSTLALDHPTALSLLGGELARRKPAVVADCAEHVRLPLDCDAVRRVAVIGIHLRSSSAVRFVSPVGRVARPPLP